MKFPNPQKIAFTLLELVVVIIVIGVLGSIALPKFFGVVERSRVKEAFDMIGVIRGHLEMCHSTRDDYTLCEEWDYLPIDNPNESYLNFQYDITGTDRFEYAINATRTTTNHGDGTSSLYFVRSTTSYWYYGTGIFKDLTWHANN